MINVVIDTNVLISAALSIKGNPAKVIECITDLKEIKLFYAEKIFDEYKKVLAYERLNIDIEMQDRALNLIKKIGILIEPTVSTIPLPDETDRIFYDTAKANRAILITGNTKHFPAEPSIMTPTEFLDILAT